MATQCNIDIMYQAGRNCNSQEVHLKQEKIIMNLGANDGQLFLIVNLFL